ncbi:MAG: hypothetical protein KAH01_00735 [Caldisericia bacterium]|nr:hypothetical protein [Caldisericia bacterium]
MILRKRKFIFRIIALSIVFMLFFSNLNFHNAYALKMEKIQTINFSNKTLHTKKETIQFEFDISKLKKHYDNGSWFLQLDGSKKNAVPGKPYLLTNLQMISSPENCSISSIELCHIEKEEITLEDCQWYSSPPEYSLSREKYDQNEICNVDFSRVNSEHQDNQAFPSVFFTAYEESIYKVNLKLYPVIYTSKRTAYFIKKFTFSIEYNYLEKNGILSINNDIEKKGLIISPDSFFEAAEKAKKLQLKNGVKSRIILLSSIDEFEGLKPVLPDKILGYEDVNNDYLETYDASLAYKIRACIKSIASEHQIDYVTILGDAESVPASYYVFSENAENEKEQWIPTDLFYADYSDDLNVLKPLLAVGRIPCSNSQEAIKMLDNSERSVEKLIKSKKNTIMLSGGDLFPKDRYFGELIQADSINIGLLPSNNYNKQFTTEEKCTSSNFLSGLKQDFNSIVWAFGHGDGEALYQDSGKITSEECFSWDKEQSQYMMVSEGCGNAAFDTKDIYKSSYVPLSKALLLSEGGFSSYFGSVRDCWCGWDLEINNGIPNINKTYYSEALIRYLFLSMTTELDISIGIAVQNAFTSYINEESYIQNEPFLKTLFGFSFQGDPTLPNPLIFAKKDFEKPEIDSMEPKSYYNQKIPVFSTNADFDIELYSSSSYITYYLYDENNDIMVLEMVFNPTLRRENNKNYYYLELPELLKGEYIARFETEQGLEERIYIQGKNEHDLILVPNLDLSILKTGEKKNYYTNIINEGYSLEKDVSISIYEGDRQIAKKMIEYVPAFSSRKIFYQYNSMDPGEKQLNFKLESSHCVQQKKEWINISSKKITRVGILCEEDLKNRDQFLKELMVKEINKDLGRRFANIEIQVVPFACDENNFTTFDRLNFDVIILYKKRPKNILPSKLLFELTEFELSGGTVIGILPFGFSQKEDYETDLLLQNYFGISKEEKIRTILLDNTDRKLNISDREMLEHFEKEYRLESRYGLSSLNKSWSLVSLNETAKLVGISNDGKLAFIKNKNRLLYTGFFNSDSFNSFDESYSFFIDVLNFAKANTINKVDISERKEINYSEEAKNISPQNAFTDTSNDFPLFASSTIYHKQEIWLTALQGFYITTIGKPEKFSFIPYPDELIKKIGPLIFKRQIITPNSARFRFYNNKIVFNGNNNIYIFDPYNPDNGINTLKRTMYDTYMLPIYQYDDILDFEVFGDSLFILNKDSNISVINLENGEIEYCIGLRNSKCIDISVIKNKIFVLTKLNRIVQINITNEAKTNVKIQELNLGNDIQPNSFFIANEINFYINFVNHENKLFKFNGIEEGEISLDTVIEIDSESIGASKQFCINNNNLIGIYQDKNSEKLFENKGTWLLFDINKGKIIASTESDLEYYKEYNNTLFPNNIWMLKDGTLMVSQQEPVKNIFQIYSISPLQMQGSININNYAPTFESIHYEYHESGYLYVLMVKELETMLLKIDPLNAGNWEKIDLPIIDSEKIDLFSVWENTIAIYKSNGSIEIIDLKTRLLQSKFIPLSSEQEKYPACVSQIFIDSDEVFVLDSESKQVFGFSYNGEITYSYQLPLKKSSKLLSVKYIKPGTFAILDKINANIRIFFQNRIIAEYNIDGIPLSYYVTDDMFIINDYFCGLTIYPR